MSSDKKKPDGTQEPTDASAARGDVGDASLDKVVGGVVDLYGEIVRDAPPPRHGGSRGDHSALD